MWPVKKCIFFFFNNNFFFFWFYLRPVAPSRPRRKAVHFGAEVRLFRFSCRRTVAACASHSSWCRVFDFLKNFVDLVFWGFWQWPDFVCDCVTSGSSGFVCGLTDGFFIGHVETADFLFVQVRRSFRLNLHKSHRWDLITVSPEFDGKKKRFKWQ